ncbi:MAG: DUF4173 domain-containing protein [Anaerolineaceae bacterium]|nr:DUF4173 domain-containing protein [Anaerolineaceae bacterium]
MIRFPWRFTIVALGVAWAVDFLFWKKTIGISFLIWILLLLIGSIILSKSEKKLLSPINIIPALAALVFAAISFIRTDPFTQVINLLFSMGAIFVLASSFSTGHWVYYRLVDYLTSGFHGFISAFARPVELGSSAPSEEIEVSKEFSWKTLFRHTVPVLRGLFLALPVVIVLGALLASADPIFSDRLDDILKIFDLSKLGEYIFRMFYILILAYIFAGLYLFAIHPKRKLEKPDPTQPWMKTFLGWTEAAIILVCVDLLFALFVGIQFKYFFGGNANITAAGYTFSEYARRGFGELVVVAVLSLLLYLALGTITRQEKRTAQRGFSVLSIALIGMVLVMLVSAFQRVILYENAYGFTRLRTYPHIFMVWLGILLAITVVFEIMHNRGRFALALLISSFGFCMTLGIINVDQLIVQQNITRTRNGEEIDGDYIRELSDDSVPALIEAYNNPNLNQDVKDTLGADLACRAVIAENGTKRPWQSFHLSNFRTQRLLHDHRAEWSSYPVIQDEDGMWTVMINDETIYCEPFYWRNFD